MKNTTVELERLRRIISTYLNDELAHDLANGVEVEALHDVLAGMILVNVRASFAGKHLDQQSIEHPYDWWQAFKERWFPAWLKRLSPVRYAVYTMTAIEYYPQLSLPDRSDGRVMIDRIRWS